MCQCMHISANVNCFTNTSIQRAHTSAAAQQSLFCRRHLPKMLSTTFAYRGKIIEQLLYNYCNPFLFSLQLNVYFVAIKLFCFPSNVAFSNICVLKKFILPIAA